MSIGPHFKDGETKSWRGSAVMPEVTQPVGGPGVGGEGGEEGIPEQALVFVTTA